MAQFFCAGTVVDLLGSLGFGNVYNRCEDFYHMLSRGALPDYDVIVTNPPYSHDHKERTLK